MKLQRPTNPTITLVTVVFFAVVASVWGPRRQHTRPDSAVPRDSRDSPVSRLPDPSSDLEV